jgi:hypothetical protein
MRSGLCRRFTGWLALFALALQFALSFAHVHLDGIRPDYQSFAVAAATAQAVRSAPVPSPGDEDDGYCAICATIYLAANSFVPQAPQLPVPIRSARIQHVDRVAALVLAPCRAPFQSRAPPLA